MVASERDYHCQIPGCLQRETGPEFFEYVGLTGCCSHVAVSCMVNCLYSRNHRQTVMKTSLLLTLLAGFTLLAPTSQSSETTLLLRNVKLFDREQTGDKTVNLLLKDSKLDIITEDLIPLADADEAYDAGGGLIMGKLELGQTASFVILDRDPRQNPKVLLDTKTHVKFAVLEGEVVRNRLIIMLEDTREEEHRARQGWLAYAPPPLAVPLDYADTTRWNRFEGKRVSGIAVAGLLLDRQAWTEQDAQSKSQVGNLKDYEGGKIRGLRIGGVGTINLARPWVWTLFVATHAFDKGFDSEDDDDWSLYDARLDIPVLNNASLSIGKQKEPISMTRIITLVDLPQQERAVTLDALLPSRNTGIVMAGTLFEDTVTLAGGVFNNWLDKDQPASFSDNTTQYVGRATAVAWVSENESTLLHVGAGYRHADMEEPGIARSTPEFDNSPLFIDTGLLAAERSDTWQGEISLRSGPLWLHSEYIRSDLDAAALLDPTFEGYHLTASWILTGEMRPYNRRIGIFQGVPIARTVQQNGWGAWEISARYSELDTNDGLVEGGDIDIWSAGFELVAYPLLQHQPELPLHHPGQTGDGGRQPGAECARDPAAGVRPGPVPCHRFNLRQCSWGGNATAGIPAQRSPGCQPTYAPSRAPTSSAPGPP